MNVKLLLKLHLLSILVFANIVNAQDADVALTQFLVDDPTPDVAQVITYTLEATNLGTLTATNVKIENKTPSVLTFVSSGGSGTYNPISGVWDVGTLTASESKQLLISTIINPGTSGTSITNFAKLLSLDQSDSLASNNFARAAVQVTSTNLTLTKAVDDETPNEGQTVEFTLKVKNNGPADATSVIVNDIMPDGLTYVSDDSGGTYDNISGDWTIGSIADGVTEQIKILAQVDTNTAAQIITNNFTLKSFDQVDDDYSDNKAAVQLFVNGADLAITKTVNDTNPAVNDVITYTITVSNNGPLKANNITVLDVLPPELAYQSSTNSQGDPYNSLNGEWFANDLNAGASATLTIDALVGLFANGQRITNTASIQSVDEDDSIVVNNSDSANIGVGSADIEVVKNVNVPTASEGALITYSIQITNNSNTTTAFNSSVIDVLPDGVTYVSDDSAITSTTYDLTTGLWDSGDISTNSSKTLNIVCSVNTGTGGLVITNTASGSSIMDDANLANNQDTASFQVNGADLEISNSVDNPTPTEGDTINYTITVTNNGTDTTTNVSVLAEIPFSVSHLSNTPSQGTFNETTGNWTIGTIPNGGSVSLNISATVRLGGCTYFPVSISASDEPDGIIDNNKATATIHAKKQFAAGASIIDMGVTPQTYNNGLIPYGLVYELTINHKIPVYWLIASHKTWGNTGVKQDHTDITINGKDYKGGPFVIPAEFMSIAQPVIDTWVASYPGLTIDANLPAFDGHMYDYITSFPRAVLDEQNGDKIQTAFYDNAKVPFTYGRIGTPDDLTLCDDIYTMPHADPQNWTAATVNTLIDFIENGGYFWAACHAVSAMEGLVDTDSNGIPDLNLLSKNGLIPWGDHADGTPPYSYNAVSSNFNSGETASDPLMQFMSTMDGALLNGSEQIYIPDTEGWRSTTVLAITDNDHPEVIDGTYPTGPATALAYGRAFGDESYGMVMYEGSHSITGGTEAEDVAAARAYGNFVLQSGLERRPKIVLDVVQSKIADDLTLTITGEVTGISPPFTYSWVDSCGGSFDNPSALNVTYTPPTINGAPLECLLTLDVVDNCGRANFVSFILTIDKDSDDDGVLDGDDLDDDNDGIPDVIEENGNPLRDTDNDGIVDRLDVDADGDGIFDMVEGGLTLDQISFFDTDNDGVIDDSFSFGPNGLIDDLEISTESGTVDYDGNGLEDDFTNSDADGFYNFQDIDADNDGIPDNIEAQTTLGYIAPDATINSLGVNNAYPNGIVLTDTDKDGIPDYIDSDSDNDGIPDIEENGMSNTLLNIDSDLDGLDDSFEGISLNDFDVNDEIDDPTASILPDTDGDLFTSGDLDYRDLFNVNPPQFSTLDFDGIDDYLSTPSFIDGSATITLMAWIKADLENGLKNNVTIAGEDESCRIFLNDGNIPGFSIKTGSNATTLVYGNPINYDEWHHITGTYSSITGLQYLYVDGLLIGTLNTGNTGVSITNTATANGAFEVGRLSKQVSEQEYFKGDIDEVRVFQDALSGDQIQRMVYQEIQNNYGLVRGTVIQKDIIDINTGLTVSWLNLLAYYPMTNIVNNTTTDFSSNSNTLFLHNITTYQEQTAPMPYETVLDGDWTTEATWLHGDVWDIEDVINNKDWSIVKINNNITLTGSSKTIGLFIDNNKSLIVNGDNVIENSWYFELNGTLDLKNDSQLVQTSHSDLVTSTVGKILRRQEGHSNFYRYNYWGSPVGLTKATLFINNNLPTNNPNNTDFNLEKLKNHHAEVMQFTSSYNTLGKISTRWLYNLQNGVTYFDWDFVSPTTNLASGVGYIHKGTGASSPTQLYIFEGKPNNGTIVVPVTDVGGPGSIPSQSKTEYLFGNPYPSALDIHQFIDDNEGVIDGTLQLWQQWSGDSHVLREYEGGYAQVNKLGSVRAYQFVGLEGETTNAQDGTKTPSKYLSVAQGFITEVVADGSVVFNNDQRVFIKAADADGSYNNGATFFRTKGSSTSKSKQNENNKLDSNRTGAKESSPNVFQKIRLEFNSVTGPPTRRELLLGFSEETTDGYDYGYDAINTVESTTDLNLLMNEKNATMLAYGPITNDKVIPLNLISSGDYTYEIKITEIQLIDNHQAIYLLDKDHDTQFKLNGFNPYRFSSRSGAFKDRFEIVFQSKEALNIQENMEMQIEMYYNQTDKKLIINGLSQPLDQLLITNLLGQNIFELSNVSSRKLKEGISLEKLTTGVYLATAKMDSDIITKKILVR
ncbi:LamG-like jellyroll fold domain-containing protein [Geojedonia litorea]|uniref:LamG-like jellyroll fold domain-containing protein n=1 Tax=Geojedonia litorea TaxID=1268269 RepID=A0ABV9N705_9FLAO